MITKPTVYNTGPQSTRITTSMAYDLQFELKSKQAGLTKNKHSIALSKLQVTIRQTIGHSSLKIYKKK